MNIWISPESGVVRSGWRLLIQIALMIMVLIISSVILPMLPVDPDLRGLGTILMFLSIVISVALTARFVENRSFSTFGMTLDAAFLRDYAAGWLIAMLMQVFIVAQFTWAGTLTEAAFTPNGSALSQWPFWGLLLMMLMVGFHEELWTRGYQLLVLTEGFTVGRIAPATAAVIAALLTSSFFGVLHATNPNATLFGVVNIVMAGLWLALPYLITGRLALSIGLHSGWNFVMGGIFGLPISGLSIEPDQSVFHLKPQGQEWLTGGAFGPEGGISGVLALVFGTLLLLLYFRLIAQRVGLHPMFVQTSASRTSPPPEGD